jgi:hypothetical protein
MSTSKRAWIQVAGLTLALAFLAGCSQDKEPTGLQIQAEGPVGQVTLAVDSLLGEYFLANAEMARSLAFFGALFGGAFGAPAFEVATPVGRSPVLANIPPQDLGKTFGYDPGLGRYVATGQPGAPANGVRFLIYEVGSSGTPASPLNQIGHVDIDEAGQLPTITVSLSVVLDGVTVLHLEASGSAFGESIGLSISGYVSNPAGTGRLDFTAGISGSMFAPSLWYTIRPLPDVELTFSEYYEPISGESQISVAVYKGSLQQLEFDLEIYITADAAGNITSGRAYVFIPTDMAAEISGTLDSPVLTGVQEGGAPFPQADAAAVNVMFQALRQIHGTLQAYIDVGIAVLTSGIG